MQKPVVKKLVYSVVIIFALGILSYPIYAHHRVTARRHRVVKALKCLVNRMNEYYSLQGNYTKATPKTLMLSEINKVPGYELHISRHGHNHFTLSASPVGSQKIKDAQCGTLSLTDSGKKYITGRGKVKSCWFL